MVDLRELQHEVMRNKVEKGFNTTDVALEFCIGATLRFALNIAAIAKVPDFGGLSFTINDSQFMYGHFINALVSFALVAASVFFFVVKPMNVLIARARKEPPTDPTTKKCTECLSEIPIQAKKCAHCTSVVA